ncbi:hypothetical protein N431DRAFT_361446 [Stipitochalara longipes BDJ]|nr:hypothetical protein N431DRAFT_361446 [Stipitochalara longipes BDJ]
MPRRLHSYHRFFCRRRADARKKDRYIKGSALFCTAAGGISLASLWKERNQRLRIEEYLRINEQLIGWCNEISETFVKTEHKRVKRQAFVEERLINLGVLRGWELIEAEEDKGNDDNEGESGNDEAGHSASEISDEGDSVGVQDETKEPKIPKRVSEYGEREHFEFVEGFDDDDEDEKMEHQNANIKKGRLSRF